MIFKKGDIIIKNGGEYPADAMVVDGVAASGELLVHQIGGCLQLIVSDEEIHQFSRVSEYESVSMFRKAVFQLEDFDEQFSGWSDGRLWNGWAMPYFEIEEATRVIAAISPDGGKYDSTSDAFITPAWDDEVELWAGVLITLPDGEKVKVYPIGAGSWIWDSD